MNIVFLFFMIFFYDDTFTVNGKGGQCCRINLPYLKTFPSEGDQLAIDTDQREKV